MLGDANLSSVSVSVSSSDIKQFGLRSASTKSKLFDILMVFLKYSWGKHNLEEEKTADDKNARKNTQQVELIIGQIEGNSMLSYANNKSEISLHICAVFVARRLTNSFYSEEQIGFTNIPSRHQSSHIPGADPGFLERGFICTHTGSEICRAY